MRSKCLSAACIILLAGCSVAERPVAGTGAAPPPPGHAAPPPPISQPAPAPAGGMTLADALRTALARNPDLAAIRGSEEVSRAALEVAGTYPYNPQLTVDVRPYTRDADGNSQNTFVAATLLQEIELARQGRHRRREGEAGLERARAIILDQESRVVTETGRRFFTALARRSMRDLDGAQARLKDELLAIVERRFQAGLAASSELALARVEARSARQLLDISAARESAAILELRKQLGLVIGEALTPAGDFEGWRWPAPAPPSPEAAPAGSGDRVLVLGRLMEMAAGRPDVLAAEADLLAMSARSDLASAARVPNIAVGPVYEHDESRTTFLGVETQIALPIFSTGGPLYRQRQAEVRQGAETVTQLQARARLEVLAALQRYEEAWRLVERFRRDLADGFEPELQGMRDQFEAGLTSILEVHAAQANVQKGRSNLLDAQLELALAAVDLTAAAGLPADALLVPRPTEGPPK